MHCLLFLHQDDNFLEHTMVDDAICAELPPPKLNPDGSLTKLMQEFMTHGLCGSSFPNAPCMAFKPDRTGSYCTKHFPKHFCPETIVDEDGYPEYHQPQNGHTWQHKSGTLKATMDNQWIVPYNPHLLKKYQAHVNVEACSSVAAIKYIHKYIYKGEDCTTTFIQNEINEINQYLNECYIGPHQAVWCILEYPIHEEFPSVLALQVHLPGQQQVVFNENADETELKNVLENAEITLTAWFQYNNNNSDGQNILYQNFPQQYVWHKSPRTNHHWLLQKNNRFQIN